MKLMQCFAAFSLFCCMVSVHAVEKTPSGFYFPIDNVNASGAGEWLERDSNNIPKGTYFSGWYHLGVDLGAKLNDSVYAIAEGRVVYISNGGWTTCLSEVKDASGKTFCSKELLNSDGHRNIAIVISHMTSDGKKFLAIYGHVREGTSVNIGDNVSAKQVLGKIGLWKEGIHLHFSIVSPIGSGSKNPPYPKNFGRAPNSEWPKTFGQEDPLGFIMYKKPFTNEAKLDKADKEHNLNVLDEICRVSKPDPRVEQWRIKTWLNKLIHWITPSDRKYSFYSNKQCDVAYVDFSGTVFGGGDSDGPGPDIGKNHGGKKPDLKLKDLKVIGNKDHDASSLRSVSFGQEVWAAFKVKSEDEKSGHSFDSRVYVSDGSKFDGKDSAQHWDEHTKELGKNDDHWEYRRLDSSIEYPGQYTVHVWVDSEKRVDETNEDNNFKQNDGYIFEVRGSADVSVNTVQTDKSEYLLGEAATVNVYMTNLGPHPFGKTAYLDYYVDGALQVLPEGKERIKRENLKPGMIKNENASISIPPYYGVHEIKACFRLSGSDERTSETNPANNCSFTNVTVTEPTNLTADTVNISPEVALGSDIAPSISVMKNGASIAAPVRVDWYLNQQKIGESFADAGLLNTLGWADVSLSHFVVPTAIGSADLSACLDIPNAISEVSKSDNCAGQPFQIVTNTSIPGSGVYDASMALHTWYEQLVPKTSCLPDKEPNFNVMPAVAAVDIGTALFGNTKQRIFVPDSNMSLAKVSGLWQSFPGFDMSKITKWCFASDTSGWSTATSQSCGVPHHAKAYWYVDMSARVTDKGTWVFVQGGKEYWVRPDKYTSLPLDSDGHIRYGLWQKPTVYLSKTLGSLSIGAWFGDKVARDYWIPPGAKLDGRAFWFNDVDGYPGAEGKLYCDANKRLRAVVPDIVGGSTGRLILGTDTVGQYAWPYGGGKWILPAGAVLAGDEGNYRLPLIASPVQRQAVYDVSRHRLTLTIYSDEKMKRVFGSVADLTTITSRAWLQTWVKQTGFIEGTVSRSTQGVWSVVFENVSPGIGGSVFLVLQDGSRVWQNVGLFSFASNIVADMKKGEYRIPE